LDTGGAGGPERGEKRRGEGSGEGLGGPPSSVGGPGNKLITNFANSLSKSTHCSTYLALNMHILGSNFQEKHCLKVDGNLRSAWIKNKRLRYARITDDLACTYNC